MGRTVIVVAEPDRDYMSRLETGLVKMFWKEADLELISDPKFFVEYFAAPKKIDLLLIDESMYTERLRMHDIGKVFILTEDPEPEEEEDGQDVFRLYKFSNRNALLDRIASAGRTDDRTKERRTKVVTVISPSGGAGSTTVAIGICASMRDNLKSAFYINPQMYQNFHYYLRDRETVPMELCMKMQDASFEPDPKVKTAFLKEGFTYFPPLGASRESLGITAAAYLRLSENVVRSKEYDYVVIDLGNELSGDSVKFLDMADRVLTVTRQDAYAAFKLRILKKSMNFSDADKYIFICNHFDRQKENALADVGSEYSTVIHEYIEADEAAVSGGTEGLKTLDGMQRTAYMLL